MGTQPAYRVVLFDLDGTLSDSAPGIIGCMQHALQVVGAPLPDPDAMYRWVGPPLDDTLGDYLGDAARAEQALRAYRVCYSRQGWLDNRLHDGVPELLADLHRAGVRLMLATTKGRQMAEQIVTHFGLRGYFDYVGGASSDGTVRTKAEVIATLLPLLHADERSSCVMVGDREYDVLGARAHGIECIVVEHGYATPAELTACTPLRVVPDMAALRGLLFTDSPSQTV